MAHDGAIRGCEAAFSWVDGIIICSKTRKEHISNMRQVLEALQECELVINGKSVPELDYHVGLQILAAASSHVVAIHAVSEFIDPLFAKTSPKRSFSMT